MIEVPARVTYAAIAVVVAGLAWVSRPDPPPAEFELLDRAMVEQCGRYNGEGIEAIFRITKCEDRVCEQWRDVCDRMETWREMRQARESDREESRER